MHSEFPLGRNFQCDRLIFVNHRLFAKTASGVTLFVFVGPCDLRFVKTPVIQSSVMPLLRRVGETPLFERNRLLATFDFRTARESFGTGILMRLG